MEQPSVPAISRTAQIIFTHLSACTRSVSTGHYSLLLGVLSPFDPGTLLSLFSANFSGHFPFFQALPPLHPLKIPVPTKLCPASLCVSLCMSAWEVSPAHGDRAKTSGGETFVNTSSALLVPFPLPNSGNLLFGINSFSQRHTGERRGK